MAENRDVREPVIEHAKRFGILARRLVMLNRRGYPDTTFMKNGIVILMEFKDVDGGLSLLQEREIAKLRKAGVTVYVVDSVEDGIAILNRTYR